MGEHMTRWIYRFAGVLLAACALLAPAAGMAQTQGPEWLRKPRLETIVGAIPADAADRQISGKATLGCTVNIEGRMVGCTVLSESPKDMGFGRAALSLTPQFVMRPAMEGGKPVPTTVKIPITFPVERSPRLMMREKVVTNYSYSSTIPWDKAPTHDDLRAAYPAKAKAAGVGGAVALQCGFAPDRNVRNCEVIKEEPEGYGFGLAAKVVAKGFVLPPVTITKQQLLHATTQIAISFSPTLLQGPAATGRPAWSALPDANAMNAALGGRAGGDVNVRLACTVVQGGGLDGCAVVSEQPASAGVGAAALTLMPLFRTATWTSEGLPVVGGRVTIPLIYRVETRVETTAPPVK